MILSSVIPSHLKSEICSTAVKEKQTYHYEAQTKQLPERRRDMQARLTLGISGQDERT
jgi:hypothetical protein